jgi:hypothetical protein
MIIINFGMRLRIGTVTAMNVTRYSLSPLLVLETLLHYMETLLQCLFMSIKHGKIFRILEREISGAYCRMQEGEKKHQ